MLTLEKTENAFFKEFYTGYNPQTGIAISAILDDNCVRWMSHLPSGTTRHELRNDQKALCLKNATRSLNRK